ncbi:hypothetical protein [Bacillus cereus]|uniref:hypothetical protein n=1 Tax=Bacillus cereus TaxID=1396 RepID=UPI000BFE40FA|nr:hypothetical protein [Bacillus cereus]PGR83474.1 hypothetical protein COC63_05680 [Bacillus cereus]
MEWLQFDALLEVAWVVKMCAFAVSIGCAFGICLLILLKSAVRGYASMAGMLGLFVFVHVPILYAEKATIAEFLSNHVVAVPEIVVLVVMCVVVYGMYVWKGARGLFTLSVVWFLKLRAGVRNGYM